MATQTAPTDALAHLADVLSGTTDAKYALPIAEFLVFAGPLAPAQIDTLGTLLSHVIRAVEAQGGADAAAHWRRVLRHAPGLAPMLELLNEHATECQPPCCYLAGVNAQ